jgi:hypothetical protein
MQIRLLDKDIEIPEDVSVEVNFGINCTKIYSISGDKFAICSIADAINFAFEGSNFFLFVKMVDLHSLDMVKIL